ncbi:MAG: hypothetical protein GC157_06465 [Frankiales bacterium]|nr:hypothetical protein [Frankiales bacterium]
MTSDETPRRRRTRRGEQPPATDVAAAPAEPTQGTAADRTATESTAAESTATESTAAESTAAESTAAVSAAADSTAAQSATSAGATAGSGTAQGAGPGSAASQEATTEPTAAASAASKGVTAAGAATVPTSAESAPVGGSRRAAVLRLLRRPAVSLAVAAALLVVVALVGQLLVPQPTRADTAPVAEPVASAELVCPVTSATSTLSSTVSAGVVPLPGVEKGVATLADLTTKASASQPMVIDAPGGTVTRKVTGSSGPAQLARATGSFAGGFGADQLIRSGQGASRGLAVAPCARPLTDAWIIGGSSTVGRLTQVLLVNDDDRPAQVDLLVYGPTGQVTAPGGAGIVLGPSSRKQVRLDSLAPNQLVTAVHLLATSGRVGVVGLDQSAEGLVPLGMALLPATQAGTDLVIPDVPAGVSGARLDLLAPGTDTTVAIELLTADGPIVPAGIDHVDLQAGHVTSVDLGPALAGEAAGVVVSSSDDVVAGVVVGTGGGKSLREKDATAGTPRLSAPGIVVGLRGGAFTHAVGLAAPDTDSVVRLDVYTPGATQPSWTRTVSVTGGTATTVAVPVTTPTARTSLVVTPVSGGAVYATHEVREAAPGGTMLALAPIYPIRATTVVPPVVQVPGSSIRVQSPARSS